jgi:hypothetical protein
MGNQKLVDGWIVVVHDTNGLETRGPYATPKEAFDHASFTDKVYKKKYSADHPAFREMNEK